MTPTPPPDPPPAAFSFWAGSNLHWGSSLSDVQAALGPTATTELKPMAIFLVRGGVFVEGCKLQATASGRAEKLDAIEMDEAGPTAQQCFGKIKARLTQLFGEPSFEDSPMLFSRANSTALRLRSYWWRQAAESIRVSYWSDDRGAHALQVVSSNPRGSVNDLR